MIKSSYKLEQILTSFQPLMNRSHCPFTPYLTQFGVASLQELSWYLPPHSPCCVPPPSLFPTDRSLWIPGGWHLQTEIPCCWQTLATARRTDFLLHRQRGRRRLVLQQHRERSTCFPDSARPRESLLTSFVVFVCRVSCGKLRRSLGPCWFLLNTVTMENPCHLVTTLTA